MQLKTETFNIRIEHCEKCYEHYNNPSLNQSKSYHLTTKPTSNQVPKVPNFFDEQELYRKNYQTLRNSLDRLQDHYLESENSQNEELNYQLAQSPKRLQRQKKQRRSRLHVPIFKILQNKPYKYLSKLPDTKISTKRYLNTTTSKITEFPRKDSFEVYFQNLLVFSKLSFGKWPNIHLIQKIIKRLVDYCRVQGPLMQNLKPFINDYLDIKSLSPNSSLNPPLYEYLILTSNLQSNQIEAEQDQNKLIHNLELIIYGKAKILRVDDSNNQQNASNIFRRREILPYSLVQHKFKASTVKKIYLGKQNRLDKSSQEKNLQPTCRFYSTQTKVQQIPSTQKQFKSKPKNRPLSSNYHNLRKSSFLINGSNTKRNQLFTMIKMGDIQENLFQQQIQVPSFEQTSNQINKQLKKLCSINKKYNSMIKSQGKITKRAKLYVNYHFNPIIRQNQAQIPHEDTIIWTKFDKLSTLSKRNSKNSQINEANSCEREDEQNKDKKKHGLSYRNSANNLLKIVPSKKIKRASLFLNQRQSSLIDEQLKSLTQNLLDNQTHYHEQAQSNSLQKDSKNIKKPRISQKNSHYDNGPSKKYREDDSSSSSGDNHSVFSKVSDDGEYNLSKIKVIQRSIEKKKSVRESQISKSSKISRHKSNINNQLNQEIQKIIKPRLHNQHHNSALLKSPNKLSVKSRRKSSFYYSNAKNNSLIELMNSSRMETGKEDEEKKKPKRSTKKSSRLNMIEGIKELKNTVFQIPRIEEGVQCNMEQQLLKLDLERVNSNEGVKSQQSYQQLNSAQETMRDTIQDTLGESVKESPRESKVVQKSSFLPQLWTVAQFQQQRQTLLTNTMRSSRASGFNNRISKYSFQNHQSIRDQLNQSRQKEQDQMVAVFPQNIFCHAFIVNKFSQKNYYDIQIKKMFTTSESQKSQLFEFDVNCGQLYLNWKLYSVTKLLKQPDRKFTLFPKIFKQVDGYSTPLVQVVNRLLKFHPISISRLFTNAHGLSPLGQYCIWVYHKGINQFKPVFVNDIVPFYLPDSKQSTDEQQPKRFTPVYGPLTNQNSIWFMLLQKALAKVVGSYFTLNETSISDIFSMLTGCPVVNVDHITEKKLQKIFDQKIFLNKKAYVYGLNRLSPTNMRIDRVIGMECQQNESRSSVAIIEEKQGTQQRKNLESMIRTYQEICLLFFNLSFFFNQVQFPMLEKSQDRVSTLITFYIINEEVDEKNQIYLCLGGFGKPQLKSKIIIYQEAQEHQNNSLKQLQLTDPLSYYNQKYTYQGEIQRKGNYFFETEIKYGKYLCLIEAQYQCDHQYYISTYTSKPITIHDIQHNYTEVNNQQIDPLEKIIAAATLRMELKRGNILEPIDEDGPHAIDYPLNIVVDRRNSFNDEILPYDFSNYKNLKKKKFKSSVSIDQMTHISSKWVIEKKFVQDGENLLQRRQRNISGLINHIQRQQHKHQHAKLKKQLQTNEKDTVMKMMSRVGKKQKSLNKEGILRKTKTKKKKRQANQLGLQQQNGHTNEKEMN